MTTVVRVPSLLIPVIPRFMIRMREQADRLSAAIEAGDFAVASRIGHNLKGTGGGYGFDFVSAAGARIQALAEESDAAALAEEIRNLKNDLARVEIVAA